jgi:hypothetical protein
MCSEFREGLDPLQLSRLSVLWEPGDIHDR